MGCNLTSLIPDIRRLVRLALTAIVIAGFLALVGLAQGNEDTGDAVAIFNQAQNAHEKGDLPTAINLYEKALKILPEFPEAEYQRGTALLALGKTDDAEKGFRRSVELRPDWTLALTSLGSLLVQKEKYADAESILSKAIELEPQNPPALVAMTDLRLRTKASQNVLKDLLTKIAILTSKAKPTAALWSAKAALETSLGKTDLAKSSLQSAIAIDPNLSSALFQIADIALTEGDIERARNIAAIIEKTGQGKDELIILKAVIYAHENNADEAVKQLDSISRPNAAAIDLRNRIVASRTTNPAELEKQLAVDSKNPILLGKLCSLFRKDDPAKALDYCRRASEAEPDNVGHAVGFAAALVQAKQFDAAVALLRKIIKIVPENWTAHANLGTALFQLKNYPEAKAEFEWLTAKQPREAGAYYFLALSHDQLSEYLDAMANYQQYLRLADPVENKLDIEKVNLRLPQLQRLIKEGKGKKNE